VCSNFSRIKLSPFLGIGSHAQKSTSGSYATTNMTVKRTGVAKKHHSLFALFSDGFHPQTDEVYINNRLNEGT
jgi:hypothetical protein